MGFMDKVKDTAAKGLASGQGKLDQIQSKRHADSLLRDLGALVYASQTGRAAPDNSSQTQTVMSMLQQHEATHGAISLAPESPGVAAPGVDPNNPAGGGGFVPGSGTVPTQAAPSGFVPGGSPAPAGQAFVPGASPTPPAPAQAFVPGATPAPAAAPFVPGAAPFQPEAGGQAEEEGGDGTEG